MTTRQKILKKAKNTCKWCSRPRYSITATNPDDWNGWMDTAYLLHAWDGGAIIFDLAGPATEAMDRAGVFKWVVTHLGLARKDHNPRNHHPDNVILLCQRCIRVHDAPQRAYRRRFGKGQLEMFPR